MAPAVLLSYGKTGEQTGIFTCKASILQELFNGYPMVSLFAMPQAYRKNHNWLQELPATQLLYGQTREMVRRIFMHKGLLLPVLRHGLQEEFLLPMHQIHKALHSLLPM